MNNTYRDEFEALVKIIRAKLSTIENLDDEKAFKIITNTVLMFFEDNRRIKYEEIVFIINKIFLKTRERLNILKPLMDDPEITEIMVNGPENIFYEKGGQIFRYCLSFDNEEELEEVMHMIAGEVNREINELNPIVDARLSDGSRVNGVYKNIAINGPSLTIRKFLNDYITMEQLVINGTISTEGAELLKQLVVNGYNIFISGGTSSGKTTLINALSDFIPDTERVVIIEDSAELKLHNIDNLVQLECRNSNSFGKGEVSMSKLIKNSLRMRPDRIIIGEVRGEEVFHMLQAMNTGHSGMSTGHGNSIEGMLKRLETMYLMAATIDIKAIRNQIAEGIDIMIHLERIGKERRVVEIKELAGFDGENYILNEIMSYGENGLKFTGKYIMEIKKNA